MPDESPLLVLAECSIVPIGLDNGLILGSPTDFGPTGPPLSDPGPEKFWLVRKLLSPPRQPIFQEPELSGLSFTFAVRSEHLHSTLFRLTTIIQTPGYCATEKWVMICEGGMLMLYDPSHPKTRTA
jgi:hypothetical protein